MNSYNTVFNLSSVAVVLPGCADGTASAFGCARFVNQTDGIGVGVVASDDLLATIAKLFFIPLDGLQKPL